MESGTTKWTIYFIDWRLQCIIQLFCTKAELPALFPSLISGQPAFSIQSTCQAFQLRGVVKSSIHSISPHSLPTSRHRGSRSLKIIFLISTMWKILDFYNHQPIPFHFIHLSLLKECDLYRRGQIIQFFTYWIVQTTNNQSVSFYIQLCCFPTSKTRGHIAIFDKSLARELQMRYHHSPRKNT